MDNETTTELLKVIDIIDGVKETLGDGKYLNICNSLKKISEYRETKPSQLIRFSLVELDIIRLTNIQDYALYSCLVFFTASKMITQHTPECKSECCLHKPIPTLEHRHISIEMYGEDLFEIESEISTSGSFNLDENSGMDDIYPKIRDTLCETDNEIYSKNIYINKIYYAIIEEE